MLDSAMDRRASLPVGNSLDHRHHHHPDPPQETTRLWGKMTKYVGGRHRSPRNPPSALDKWHDWAADQCIEDASVAAIPQKYGSICEVGKDSMHTIILFSHKYQYCPPLDHYYALKLSRRPSGQQQAEYRKRVAAEFAVASALHHRHIVQTFELLPLSHDDANLFCLCMEYCAGGDLHSLIAASHNHQLSEDQADCLFKQLLRGISYLHETGIAHRDLTPDHLLLTHRGCLKIAHFGNAASFRRCGSDDKNSDNIHLSTGRCSGYSPPYISPEQYTGEHFDPRHVDVWAAGIIYVEMRTGRNLWYQAIERDASFREYVDERRDGKASSALEALCNDRSRDLLYTMLSISPADRPAAAEVLSSEWLEGVVCCVPN
ncbi:kinase-like domain-containing protein [Aspergillus lucknowensis]|uniref:Kinase-like domain-containing protein n=1 Tax=Aspergillus lucknowensis TaxID=176173 RepID=A0ABR4LT09_9EURO